MDWAQGPETGGCVCPSPHLHVSHVHTHPCERHGWLEKILSMVMFMLFSFYPTSIFISQRGANEWKRRWEVTLGPGTGQQSWVVSVSVSWPELSFLGLSQWLGSAIFELASWGEGLCLTSSPLGLHVCKTLCVSGSRCTACTGLCGVEGLALLLMRRAEQSSPTARHRKSLAGILL